LLPTTVTPNQVTLLSVAIGIGSGLLFATGNQPAAIAGALLFLFSTIVDGCDGELARLTFRESRMGERLDLVGDNVVHIVLFGGIAVGLHRQMPTSRITVLGTLLVAGVLLAMAAVSWSFLLRRATPAQRTLFETFASREFAYLLAILTVFGKLEWFLWIAAVGTYAFVAALLLLGTRETHG
jgi:phosphatidylglycerophosphate synthase